jgi:hypothetical protein
MARFIHGSINQVCPNPGLRRRARCLQYPIGPHLPPLRTSFRPHHNWALIDWPVVWTTGVCCLFLTAALTVIIYQETRPAIRGKERIAWIQSTLKPSKAMNTDRSPATPSPSILPKYRTEDQSPPRAEGQQKSPLLSERAPEQNAQAAVGGTSSPGEVQPKYPEENLAASAIAASPILELAKTPANLGQETSPAPPQQVTNEIGQTVPSVVSQQAASCAGDYGTRMKFAKDPQEAFRLAGEQKKIVFLLQLSGNFEDPGLT